MNYGSEILKEIENQYMLKAFNRTLLWQHIYHLSTCIIYTTPVKLIDIKCTVNPFQFFFQQIQLRIGKTQLCLDSKFCFTIIR